MWNRKNSVAIQSYSAKDNKPEPEEKKRVSSLDFTVILSTSGQNRQAVIWYFITPRGSRNFGENAMAEDFEISRFQLSRFPLIALKIKWNFNRMLNR